MGFQQSYPPFSWMKARLRTARRQLRSPPDDNQDGRPGGFVPPGLAVGYMRARHRDPFAGGSHPGLDAICGSKPLM